MPRKNGFLEPCQPTVRTEPPTGLQWVHEVKFDGYRLQIHKDGNDVTLFSKNGSHFTDRFPEIAIAARTIPTRSVILDCELTALYDDGRPDFSALLQKRDAPMRVWVFDILSQFGKDLRPLTLGTRRMMLDTLMARVDTPMICVSQTFLEPQALLRECGERRMEGIVSKRVDRPYQSGPCKDWVKVKCPEWRESNQWRHEFFKRSDRSKP